MKVAIVADMKSASLANSFNASAVKVCSMSNVQDYLYHRTKKLYPETGSDEKLAVYFMPAEFVSDDYKNYFDDYQDSFGRKLNLDDSVDWERIYHEFGEVELGDEEDSSKVNHFVAIVADGNWHELNRYDIFVRNLPVKVDLKLK